MRAGAYQQPHLLRLYFCADYLTGAAAPTERLAREECDDEDVRDQHERFMTVGTRSSS
jgi:hypothetical protein